ncbi:MAG: GNAT family N-acetyltransferase [Candidatus Bathyarchaeota archaeon]|nr:GNAT family N-acetyltransferase [Candidatus Bathyarchaeota archaeon]
MELTVRTASLDDVESLVVMNKHLIEDEGSRNPMDMEELKHRMIGMIEGEWKVLLINNQTEDVGYMVYKVSPDEYFPEQSELYIRQYFIKRQHRGTGLGAQAFNFISENYFPENTTLTLDVLEINPGGRKFWEKVGFKPYLTHMKKNNDP